MREVPADAERLLRRFFRGTQLDTMLLALSLDADDPADVASMRMSMAASSGRPAPPPERVRQTLKAAHRVATTMLEAIRGNPHAREDVAWMAEEIERLRGGTRGGA